MDLLNPIFISQDNFTTQAIYALHFWDLRFNNHILRVATNKRRSQSCRLNLLSICINGFSFLLSTANTECMNEVKWFTWHLNHIILLTYIIFIFLKYIEHRENAHHFYDSIHNLDQHHSLNLFLANVTQVTLTIQCWSSAFFSNTLNSVSLGWLWLSCVIFWFFSCDLTQDIRLIVNSYVQFNLNLILGLVSLLLCFLHLIFADPTESFPSIKTNINNSACSLVFLIASTK